MNRKFKHTELTDRIIGAYYTVYNQLGYGFLEKVYENALYLELCKNDLYVEKQKKIIVYYDDREVGEYYADLIVDQKVIVELKASVTICIEHELQLVNYLRASDIEVGLLLNFGKTPACKRKVFSNYNTNNINYIQ